MRGRSSDASSSAGPQSNGLLTFLESCTSLAVEISLGATGMKPTCIGLIQQGPGAAVEGVVNQDFAVQSLALR